MIEIKEEHIKQAQNIFIGGNTFDETERVPFIRNLTTCDLLAVPGSGEGNRRCGGGDGHPGYQR